MINTFTESGIFIDVNNITENANKVWVNMNKCILCFILNIIKVYKAYLLFTIREILSRAYSLTCYLQNFGVDKNKKGFVI